MLTEPVVDVFCVVTGVERGDAHGPPVVCVVPQGTSKAVDAGGSRDHVGGVGRVDAEGEREVMPRDAGGQFVEPVAEEVVFSVGIVARPGVRISVDPVTVASFKLAVFAGPLATTLSTGGQGAADGYRGK